MKKILLFIPVFMAIAVAIPASAQVMGGGMMNGTIATAPAGTAAGANTTAQEEAAGKAIWDTLQSKAVSCADLKEDDFDVLGDFFMGNMMGGSHEAMNTTLAARLGDVGEKQMHIAMGKRLSGCDTSATYPQGSENFFSGMMGGRDSDMGGVGRYPMMSEQAGWNNKGGYQNARGFHGESEMPFRILGFVGGIAATAFFITGSMYFWRRRCGHCHNHMCEGHKK